MLSVQEVSYVERETGWKNCWEIESWCWHWNTNLVLLIHHVVNSLSTCTSSSNILISSVFHCSVGYSPSSIDPSPSCLPGCVFKRSPIWKEKQVLDVALYSHYSPWQPGMCKSCTSGSPKSSKMQENWVGNYTCTVNNGSHQAEIYLWDSSLQPFHNIS